MENALGTLDSMRDTNWGEKWQEVYDSVLVQFSVGINPASGSSRILKAVYDAVGSVDEFSNNLREFILEQKTKII